MKYLWLFSSVGFLGYSLFKYEQGESIVITGSATLFNFGIFLINITRKKKEN